jgi:outer membrane protein assembly factor BamB
MPTASVSVIYSTPAVSKDLVYVATYAGESGKVMGINRLKPGYAEGAPMRSKGEWAYPGETKYVGAVVGDLVLEGDTLFVASSDGKLYALDAAYGEKRWEFNTEGKIWTTPAMKDGVVYVGNYERKLYALSAQDGSLLWKIELPVAIASSPAVSDDSVFFGTFDHSLYAVSKADGSEKWKFKGGDWFWAKPVVKDGVVYAGCLDHALYSIDASTGKELWQFTGNGRIVASPVFWGDLLVAISEMGEIYVLESQSGALQRKVSVGYTTMAPLYLMDNLVFVHGRDRTVYCVDVQKGEVAWKFPYVAE